MTDGRATPEPGRKPLSPAALNVLQAYPLPNVSGRIFDNFATNRKEKYNRDGWGLRFDHNISSSDQIMFAYSSDKSSRARDNNFPLGTSPTGQDLPSGFGAGDEFGEFRLAPALGPRGSHRQHQVADFSRGIPDPDVRRLRQRHA